MKKSFFLLSMALILALTGCDILEWVGINDPPTISVNGGTTFTIALDGVLTLDVSGSIDEQGHNVEFEWVPKRCIKSGLVAQAQDLRALR